MKTINKPRIAIFSKQLDKWSSGSGHHLDQIMQRIVSINEKENIFDITFIHYKKSNNPIYKKVKELIIPRNPILAHFYIFKEKFDLVHYTPLTVFSPIFFVKNKKVATIHGVEQLLIPQFFGILEMLHERYLVPYYARKMDGIFTVSNTTKRYLVNYFKISENKIIVAYNGIGKEYHPRDKSTLIVPKKMGIDRPYIYHVSRFSERKNPWVILKAFQLFLLRNKNAPHILVCAGKGWDDPEVKEKAKELGIENQFITPGFISEFESAELMSGADVFLFPSLAEGFGMPNVEALASGCPVVTSSAFAIPEIVDDCAIIVNDPYNVYEFVNAIEKVINNIDFRNDLIRRGLERVNSNIFSWDIAAEKLYSFYKNLLEV